MKSTISRLVMLWLIVVLFIAAQVHAFSMKMSNDFTKISRRAAVIQSTLASFLVALGHANPCMAAYIDADTVKITQRVFLDVQIGDQAPPQRIVSVDKMPTPEPPFTEYYPIIPFKEEPLAMFLARVENPPLEMPWNPTILTFCTTRPASSAWCGIWEVWSILDFSLLVLMMPDGPMIVMPPLV